MANGVAVGKHGCKSDGISDEKTFREAVMEADDVMLGETEIVGVTLAVAEDIPNGVSVIDDDSDMDGVTVKVGVTEELM